MEQSKQEKEIYELAELLMQSENLEASAIILRDLPPFVMLGNDGKPHGINSEGLKRRGFSPETVRAIKNAYRVVYRKNNTAKEAIEILSNLEESVEEVELMTDFISNSSRGIIR